VLSPSDRLITVPALAQRLSAGSLRSVDHVREVLGQLDALAETPWANLVAARDDDRALHDAAAADRRRAAGEALGPLDGVAVAVKDNIDVEGLPTRAGSAALADASPAAADAEVVARLRRAGAVVVAKTHLHELAYGPTGTVNAAGPARNPHDPDRMTGGSSSGSAALVALGVVPLALGTDTGCSVRVPAALCGVVGLMPALGRLSTSGVLPLSTTLDHVGLLAADLESAAAGYAALVEARPGPAVVAASLRIGLPRGTLLSVADAAVASAVEQAARALEDAGAQVVDVDVPGLDELAALYPVVVGAEAHAFHLAGVLTRPELLGAPTRERLHAGARPAAEYRAALCAMRSLRAQVLAGLVGIDALLLATAPFPAPLLDQDHVVAEPVRAGLLRLCAPFSVLGTPAVSVPAPDVAGLPIGLQLVGIRLDEPALLALSRRARG